MSSEQYSGELGRTLRDEGMEVVEENSGAWKYVAKDKIEDWFELQPIGVGAQQHDGWDDDENACRKPEKSRR